MSKHRAIVITTLLILLSMPRGAAAGPSITVNVADNAVVSDVVAVKAQVSSEAGVVKVEFSVDDQVRLSLLKPPFDYRWDTIDEEEGRHTLIVNAYDSAGGATTKRIKVEVDNELTKGVKPHAEKALTLFRQEDFDGAMLEARKAYRINNADLDSVRALAAATGGKGDVERALKLLEEPQRINNQVVGNPKDYPLSDRVALELRALFRTRRAQKQTNPALLLADMATVHAFWRKLADMRLEEVRSQRTGGAPTPASLIAEGDALFSLGDMEGALGAYRKASTAGPGAAAAENRQAAVFLMARRLREAEQSLTAMVSGGRANDQTHALLAATYLRQFRFDRARAEAAGPASRGSVTGRLVSAYAELAFLNFSKAFDLLKQVDSRGPTAESRYLAACYFLDTGDLNRGTQTVFDALRMAPGNLDTYVLRALQLAILVPKDGADQALPLLDYVLKADPTHSGAKMGKTVILYLLKRPSQAEALARELLKEERFAADTWIMAAAMYAAGTEQTKATESLAEARRLSPDRFLDTVVPAMKEFLPRMARYRRPPLITPAILFADEMK